LGSVWSAIDRANKYIVTTAPFTLAKDPAERPRVGAILHHLLEALYVTAVLLKPYLPDTAARMLALLGRPLTSTLAAPWQWGTALPVGQRTEKPVILFPRIETEIPAASKP
jgi:methionyl-tRNA synthetase